MLFTNTIMVLILSFVFDSVERQIFAQYCTPDDVLESLSFISKIKGEIEGL